MVEIKKVESGKDVKEFVDFPLKTYKKNAAFVPPVYSDEMNLFAAENPDGEKCETAYFLAKRNGVTVGRISAILKNSPAEKPIEKSVEKPAEKPAAEAAEKAVDENAINDENDDENGNGGDEKSEEKAVKSGEKPAEKKVFFTRFDCENDQEAAKALFDAVEKFAAEKGAKIVCGPYGFSDIDRRGVLVEGFEELSSFEESYNAEYYGALIEACGYKKEQDWVEAKIYLPDDEDIEDIRTSADFVTNRYGLRLAEFKTVDEFFDKYSDNLFGLLKTCDDGVYGGIPVPRSNEKIVAENLRAILKVNHIMAVLNDKNEAVCIAFFLPSIGKALQKSKGKFTLLALFRLLKAINRPEILSLGLIVIRPDYLSRGVTTIIAAKIVDILKNDGVKYVETNLNQEDNLAVQNLWKRFNAERHKRRRAYVKVLENVEQ